jgi:hypothetical protein
MLFIDLKRQVFNCEKNYIYMLWFLKLLLGNC